MRHLLDCSSAELVIGLAVFSFLLVAYVGFECTTSFGTSCAVPGNMAAKISPSAGSALGSRTHWSPCFFSMILGCVSFSVLLLACSCLARPLYRRQQIVKKKFRANRAPCQNFCTVAPATCMLVVAVCAAILPLYPATSFASPRQIVSVITVIHLFALSTFTGVSSRFLLMLSCCIVVRDFIAAMPARFPPVLFLTNASYVGIVVLYCALLRLRLRRFAVIFLLAEQFPYRLSCAFLPGILHLETFNVRQIMYRQRKCSWRISEGIEVEDPAGHGAAEGGQVAGRQGCRAARAALAAVRAYAKSASTATLSYYRLQGVIGAKQFSNRPCSLVLRTPGTGGQAATTRGLMRAAYRAREESLWARPLSEIDANPLTDASPNCPLRSCIVRCDTCALCLKTVTEGWEEHCNLLRHQTVSDSGHDPVLRDATGGRPASGLQATSTKLESTAAELRCSRRAEPEVCTAPSYTTEQTTVSRAMVQTVCCSGRASFLLVTDGTSTDLDRSPVQTISQKIRIRSCSTNCNFEIKASDCTPGRSRCYAIQKPS
ncbi:hypothetical protein CSUI_001064, partial [Cystoisospora suis]